MLDDEDESSTEEDESNLEVAPPSDKEPAAKETEAGAEISALVNYVQPVHFNSFESAESKLFLHIRKFILLIILSTK